MNIRDPDVSAIARVFADPSRGSIVMALLDGDEHRAGDLAKVARIGQATASVHLRRLTEAGVVSVRAKGPERLYRLADDRYVKAVQVLASIAPDAKNPNPSLTRWVRIRKLAHARRCFDHLGGRAAIAIVDRLTRTGVLEEIDGGFLVTARGFGVLERWGLVELDPRALFVHGCDDWTEQRLHLGGNLGRLLYRAFAERGAFVPARGRMVELQPVFDRELSRIK